MPPTVLTNRILGRTLLARQHLLERTAGPVPAVVAHLVGLQAQVPRNPYLALWSRLDGFEPVHLEALLVDRELVRIVLMRGTIHLVTAADALGLRPLFLPVLEQELARHSEHAPRLRGVDLGPVIGHARGFLAEPRSNRELRDELARRFPELDPAALAYACRNHLSLVQVPPRGLWSKSGQVTCATAESWLGDRLTAPITIDEAVVRYLTAFGPASVADVSTWSRLTGIRAVVERLGPRLRTYRDEQGRELLDVADGTIAPTDAEAPVRFLPEYDNVLLSHADRSRVVDSDRVAGLFQAGALGIGTVLVDGLLQATWRFQGRAGTERVVVTHHPRLSRRERQAVEQEAHRALAYLAPTAPDATVELRSADSSSAENAGGPE